MIALTRGIPKTGSSDTVSK